MRTHGSHIYTVAEAVQVHVGNRWRNATVEKLNQHRGFVEVVAVYEDRGAKVRVLLDASSPDLRKWGEGKIAPSKPGLGRWKGQDKRRWSDALTQKG